jgi:ankyrin repeat protein
MEKSQYIIGLKILFCAAFILSTIEKGNSYIGDGNLKGSTISFVAHGDVSSLCYAVQEGDINKIEKLIRSGANVNGVTVSGDCPLHSAIGHDHRSGDVVNMVKLLVEKYGARVDLENGCYISPINYALKIGSPNIIKYLQDHM